MQRIDAETVIQGSPVRTVRQVIPVPCTRQTDGVTGFRCEEELTRDSASMVVFARHVVYL